MDALLVFVLFVLVGLVGLGIYRLLGWLLSHGGGPPLLEGYYGGGEGEDE